MNRTGIHSCARIGKPQGFTLIELMVTAAIIGILAAIAYPSYSQYVVRANRSAAESFMFSVAAHQEQYLLDARSYAPDMVTLGAAAPVEVSTKYAVTVAAVNAATPPSYIVTATPIPGTSQAVNDTKCKVLTLDQAGAKGWTGTAGTVTECWGK